MNKNLPIDPSMLDEEWLQQPLLFDQAQEEAANLQEQVDNIKNQIDEFKSQLEKVCADRAIYVRANHEKEGFAKAPAQQVVDDWVAKRPEVEATKEDILYKQKELAAANNALLRANNYVKSLQVRKEALENLCKLYGMNYFAVPNPGHMIDGGKRFIENKNQKAEEKAVEATTKLNERKQSRRGKTKEEVLDSIKNPDTKEAARKAIEAEEHRAGNEEGETGPPTETPEPRRRRRR